MWQMVTEVPYILLWAMDIFYGNCHPNGGSCDGNSNQTILALDCNLGKVNSYKQFQFLSPTSFEKP